MTSLFGKPDLITLTSLPEQPSEDLLKAWEKVPTDKAESRLKVIRLVNDHLDKRFKSSRPPGELTASEISQLVAWTNHNEFVVAYRNLWNENSLLQRQPEFMALVLYGIFGPFTPKIALENYYPTCDETWIALGSKMRTLTARFEFIRKSNFFLISEKNLLRLRSNALGSDSAFALQAVFDGKITEQVSGLKRKREVHESLTPDRKVSAGDDKKLQFSSDTIGRKEMVEMSGLIQDTSNLVFYDAFQRLVYEGDLKDFQRYYLLLLDATSLDQDTSDRAQQEFIAFIKNESFSSRKG